MSGVVYEGDCWIVTSQPSQKYPLISVLNRMYQRSRVMFAVTHQRMPEGGVVRHSCDHPACINPAHLLEGTNQDNTDDMMARGRHRPPPRKEKCLRGHERTPETIYTDGSCKLCRKLKREG